MLTASRRGAPAASIAAIAAITVSPAPETSNTSRACGRHRPCALGSVERHAVLAAREQQGLQSKFGAQCLGATRQVGFVLPAADHFAQFRPVRRQERGALVPRVIVTLGINEHPLASGLRAIDHAGDMCEAALAVVREDHEVGRGKQRRVVVQQRGKSFRFRHVFEVDAKHLLPAADHTQLDCRRQGRIAVHLGLDTRLNEESADTLPGIVVAQHRQQRCPDPHRSHVARNIGGAAQAFFTALNPHHWYRRLG